MALHVTLLLVCLVLAVAGVSVLTFCGACHQLSIQGIYYVGTSGTKQLDPLVPPVPPWPAVSAEELAADAAAYPVTIAPPVVSEPFVPLLARLRQRRAGVHPEGAQAPVHLLLPHVRATEDTFRFSFPSVAATQGDMPWAVDLATPPPPLAAPFSGPLRRGPRLAPHLRPVSLPAVVEAVPEPVPWEHLRYAARIISFLFAAAALAAVAALAARQAYPLLRAGLGQSPLKPLTAKAEVACSSIDLPELPAKSPLPLLEDGLFKLLANSLPMEANKNV